MNVLRIYIFPSTQKRNMYIYLLYTATGNKIVNEGKEQPHCDVVPPVERQQGGGGGGGGVRNGDGIFLSYSGIRGRTINSSAPVYWTVRVLQTRGDASDVWTSQTYIYTVYNSFFKNKREYPKRKKWRKRNNRPSVCPRAMARSLSLKRERERGVLVQHAERRTWFVDFPSESFLQLACWGLWDDEEPSAPLQYQSHLPRIFLPFSFFYISYTSSSLFFQTLLLLLVLHSFFFTEFDSKSSLFRMNFATSVLYVYSYVVAILADARAKQLFILAGRSSKSSSLWRVPYSRWLACRLRNAAHTCRWRRRRRQLKRRKSNSSETTARAFWSGKRKEIEEEEEEWLLFYRRKVATPSSYSSKGRCKRCLDAKMHASERMSNSERARLTEWAYEHVRWENFVLLLLLFVSVSVCVCLCAVRKRRNEARECATHIFSEGNTFIHIIQYVYTRLCTAAHSSPLL